MDILLVAIIAFLTLFIPGILVALALLKGTKLHPFEIFMLGGLFGMILPATLTWMESYLIPYSPFFSFSLSLFEINALVISIVALAIGYKEKAFDGIIYTIKYWFGNGSPKHSAALSREQLAENAEVRKLIEMHVREEAALRSEQEKELAALENLPEEKAKLIAIQEEKLNMRINAYLEEERRLYARLSGEKGAISKPKNWVWYLLFAIMVMTFLTRMLSFGITPNFFEFDPYFDMLNAQRLLVFGFQPQYSHSAWPVLANGSVMRVEPMMIYLYAYLYSIANVFTHYSTFNTSLMSYAAGVTPPIIAAFLVFIVFMLLYHEYDEYIGLIGASLVATMPVLFTTFVSGEQLLEPWGILSLFFFFASYMLAVKNMREKRYAILAGIAFASTFLGAHYYTVDAGILSLYIMIQGMISFARGKISKDFYKMNAIVIAVIAVFFSFMLSYEVALSASLPKILGIPITISGPIAALVLVYLISAIFNIFKRQGYVKESLESRLWFLFAVIIILALAVVFTPLGRPIMQYANLSAKFTTPSTPLFMTVQEFEPTGLAYNFGASGIGFIGASIFGFPLLIWLMLFAGVILLLISILLRRSDSAVFYMLIVLPLMAAGFLEVKYLPHFGVAYILLIGIVIGELELFAKNNFKLTKQDISDIRAELHEAYMHNKLFAYSVFSIVLFFLCPPFSFAFIAYLIYKNRHIAKKLAAILSILFIIWIAAIFLVNLPLFGESSSISDGIGALSISSNPNLCSILSNSNNLIGIDVFCNTVPNYWVSALAWIKQNVGPNGARVSSWWDYGDWINWFGQTPAVIRGDNAVPKEDFATAATYVLGPKDNYTAKNLYNMLNTNQTEYLLFDEGLIQKWGALDFLACVNINQTNRTFAIKQGALSNPPQPYVLGTSQCEINHDPEYAFIPLAALAPNLIKPTLSNYCSISSGSKIYATTLLYYDNTLMNYSVCTDISSNQNALHVYSTNGTELNMVIPAMTMSPLGSVNISGTVYLEYLVLYLPNKNGTITNAPSEYYYSNFYNGFILGHLNGFTLVYPQNATGINFVNGTYPIRIFRLNNFSGSLPPHTPKPSYINNNYTFP
ncbi:MAG: hypothetical protein QW582_00140 [Candidatus Micrarchaeaceae archaeon]